MSEVSSTSPSTRGDLPGYNVMPSFSAVLVWLKCRPNSYVTLIGFGACFRYLVFDSLEVCRQLGLHKVARQVIWPALGGEAQRFITSQWQGQDDFAIHVFEVFDGESWEFTNNQILEIERRLTVRPFWRESDPFDQVLEVWGSSRCTYHED